MDGWGFWRWLSLQPSLFNYWTRVFHWSCYEQFLFNSNEGQNKRYIKCSNPHYTKAILICSLSTKPKRISLQFPYQESPPPPCPPPLPPFCRRAFRMPSPAETPPPGENCLVTRWFGVVKLQWLLQYWRKVYDGDNFRRIFSCPEQLNRWPNHSLTDWLTQSLSHWRYFYFWHTQNTTEWPKRLVTFETFFKSDEETWPDQ